MTRRFHRGLHVAHAEDSPFVRRGLRAYFEYRDLGIKRATKGKVVAHVIRARPGRAPQGEWHQHDCKVQFVYVMKGWIEFEYEGIGRVKMKAGSCFYQPPNIRHREIAHSRDVQMLEIVSPADFRTLESDGPAARKSRARRSRG
jgi:quercetin dioxygenase-like cupin family protein